MSLARSVISDGAAVPSHPGRRTDGLMCGEMSREQSLSSTTALAPPTTPPFVSLRVCRLLLAFCLPLSASPPLAAFFLISVPSSSLPLIICPYPSCISLPSLCFYPPPIPRGDCVLGLQSLESVQRQCRGGGGGLGGRAPGKTSSARRRSPSEARATGKSRGSRSAGLADGGGRHTCAASRLLFPPSPAVSCRDRKPDTRGEE